MKFENLKLVETYDQIVAEISKGTERFPSKTNCPEIHIPNAFQKNMIRHTYWVCPFGSVAHFGVYPRHIKIVTAWSQFQYVVKRAPNGGATLSYDGAFAGFLEQDMIPTFTPELRADTQVEDSDGRKLSLAKYMKTKERIPRALWDLQNQIKAEEAQAEERARQREILRQLRRKG